MDAGVTWGSVDWDDDPFEELTCDAVSKDMSEFLTTMDICDMFDEEVDYAIGDDGWTPTVTFDTDNRIDYWTASAEETSGDNFTTLWFDDDLDGKIKNKNQDRPQEDARDREMHDLYDQNSGPDDVDAGNLEVIWQLLTDEDDDPNAGDLGKTDFPGDDPATD